MKISCPSCAAKYSVADEKIRARLAKIRCRKCSSTIVIDGNVDPPAVRVAEAAGAVAVSPKQAPQPAAEPSPAETGPAEGEYAVDIADNDQRNMTVEQLVEAYNTGVVTGDTYIWQEGMPDWQVVADTPEVCEALHNAADNGGAAAPVPPAAATSSADLFGGIDRAGSEDEIATSAPEAPVATGARNESSVLFSLSALTGQAEPAPKSERGAHARDDSGLIDLKALTGSNNEPAGQGLGAAAFMALPLGATSPLATGFGAAPASGLAPQPRRKGMGLWIGGAVVLCLLLGVVAFKGQWGAERVEQAAIPTAPVVPNQQQQLSQTSGAASEAAPPPTQGIVSPAKSEGLEPPLAQPPPSDLKAATAAVEPEVAEEAKPKAEVPEVRKKSTSRRKRSATQSSRRRSARKRAPEPAARKAPKRRAPAAKKATPCNCKPTDLMCAMRCSAKK